MNFFYKIMEIYFDKQILFPYMSIDLIQENYGTLYDDANIYMLLMRDKFEIIKIKKKHKYVLVLYKNLKNQKVQKMKLYYYKLYNMEISGSSVIVSIDKFGTVLNIEIQEEVFKKIREENKFLGDVPNKLIINIYDLMNLCDSENIKYENYEILYIGQSNSTKEYRTIFDRLKHHEKVVSVFRDYNLEYRDKEFMVMILHARSKLHSMAPSIIFGNSEWEKFDAVGDKIGNDAIIDVVEAMLIYHFKPHYNIKLKDSIPNINLKTYRQVVEAGLNKIEVGIDLFLQTYRNQLVLSTANQKTTSKFRVLKCDIENLYNKKQEAEIEFDDWTDEKYTVLFADEKRV